MAFARFEMEIEGDPDDGFDAAGSGGGGNQNDSVLKKSKPENQIIHLGQDSIGNKVLVRPSVQNGIFSFEIIVVSVVGLSQNN